jgi:diguanylate cyclase (GGDEF)-like protein
MTKRRQPVITDSADARSSVAAGLAHSVPAIIEPWLQRVARRPDSRTYQEARATLQALLQWAVERVAGTGPRLPPPERLAAFVQIRGRQGVDLPIMFDDVRALRDAAWTSLTPAFRRGALDAVTAGAWLNAAFDDLLVAVILVVHEQETLSLREAAATDSLTGLTNHRAFFRRLEEELRRAARIGYPVSLLLLDLDHFKQYNDEHGHPAGDKVLRQVAEVLMTQRRVTDTCARYGGEEFAMIFPGTPAADVEAIAQNLSHRVRLGTGLGFSAGIAGFPGHATSPGDLVEAADAALYRAKEEGRNRVLLA